MKTYFLELNLTPYIEPSNCVDFRIGVSRPFEIELYTVLWTKMNGFTVKNVDRWEILPWNTD
jgi:hypothetical protein